MKFNDAMNRCGIIAILRGITTPEVEAVGEALVEAGVTVAEIPLNSPDPFTSIAAMAKSFHGRLVVGAGTVLSVQDVRLLKEHGGMISVSPGLQSRSNSSGARCRDGAASRRVHADGSFCRNPRRCHHSQAVPGRSGKPRHRQGLAGRASSACADMCCRWRYVCQHGRVACCWRQWLRNWFKCLQAWP